MFNFIASALLVVPARQRAEGAGQHDGREPQPSAPARTCPACTRCWAALGIEWPRSPLNLSVLLAIAAAVAVWLLLWRSRPGYRCARSGTRRRPRATPASARARRSCCRWRISGALAGLVGINEIAGVHGRLLLDFVVGAGFAGIAVSLIGRSHPVGIVLASLLFGALYQGGAELAFEIPGFSRDMVFMLQGLIVLFSGAMAQVAAPTLARLWLALSRRRRRGGWGGDMDEVARRHADRVDAARLDAADPVRARRHAVRTRRRHRPRARRQDAVVCLRGRRGGRGVGLARARAARRGRGRRVAVDAARLCLREPPRRPGRDGHGDHDDRRRPDGRARHRLVPPGRADAAAARCGALSRRGSPALAAALREWPVVGTTIGAGVPRPQRHGLPRARAGAGGLVAAVPHPLRPAPARGRREPGDGRCRRRVGARAALPGARAQRRAVRAGGQLPGAGAEPLVHPAHDRRARLHGAGRDDLRQVASGRRALGLPAVRLPRRRRRSACRARRCRSSARCRCRRSRPCRT